MNANQMNQSEKFFNYMENREKHAREDAVEIIARALELAEESNYESAIGNLEQAIRHLQKANRENFARRQVADFIVATDFEGEDY